MSSAPLPVFADEAATGRCVVFDHATDMITAYKCTRFDGTDYRTGKNVHEVGTWIVEPRADRSDVECGPGLHWSPTIRETCSYINRGTRGPRARFFEILIPFVELMALSTDKGRSVSYFINREVPFAEAFPGCADWPGRVPLPAGLRIVTSRAAAEAAAAAAAAAAEGFYPYWLRWYVRPRYVLWRKARWDIYVGPDKPNPWEPLVEMYRLGCVPIGYAKNPVTGVVEFVVYAPADVSVLP